MTSFPSLFHVTSLLSGAAFLVLGCGGSDVPVGQDPPPALDSGGGDDAATPPRDSSSADTSACSPKYYLDADGDGFGGSTTSCMSGPNMVTMGGDCDDGNAQVFPGQTKYFTMGYLPPGMTDLSFDYDCNGTEDEESPAPAKASACTPTKMMTCTGAGALPAVPARPSAPGVDEYCGSALSQTCTFQTYSTCVTGGSGPGGGRAIACH